MILNFKVSNFKSIKNKVILDMTPSKYGKKNNLNGILNPIFITGPNRSGKSNLLLAFRAMIHNMPPYYHNLELVDIDLFKDKYRDDYNYNYTEDIATFEIEYTDDNNSNIIYRYGLEVSVNNTIFKEYLYAYDKTNPYKRTKSTMHGIKLNTDDINMHNINFALGYIPNVDKYTNNRKDFISNCVSNKKVYSYPYPGDEVKFIEFYDNEFYDNRNSNYIFSDNKDIFTDIKNTSSFDVKLKYLDNNKIYNNFDYIAFNNISNIDEDIINYIKTIDNKEKCIDFLNDYIFAEIYPNIVNIDFGKANTIEDIKLYSVREYSELNDDEQFESSLKEESYGFKKLIRLSLSLYKAFNKGGVLLIDDLDSSLDPYTLNLIYSLFIDKSINTGNCQIISTMNNLNNMIDKRLFTNKQFYILSTDNKNHSTVLL